MLECTRYYLCTWNRIQSVTLPYCTPWKNSEFLFVLYSIQVEIKSNSDFYHIVISCAYFSVDSVLGVCTLFLHHIISCSSASVCCPV